LHNNLKEENVIVCDGQDEKTPILKINNLKLSYEKNSIERNKIFNIISRYSV
jgi:hypothetical protein